MLFAVFSTVIQAHDLAARMRKQKRGEDDRTAYMHMLRVLETGLCGNSGLFTCIKHMMSRSSSGKQDPFSCFEDVMTQ